MGLKLGDTDISKIYLGTQEIDRVYKGGVVVYNRIVPTMDSFGDLVSGFVANDLEETIQGEEITTWVDSYGSNDATSTDPALTTLAIVGGKKEINFSGSVFSLGKPTDINMQPKTNSFTVVVQLGSGVNSETIQHMTSKAGPTGGLTQFTFELNSSSGGQVRSTLGTKPIFTTLGFADNDILTLVYNHTEGDEGNVKIYKNGILDSSHNPTGMSSNIVNYNLTIGGRADNGYSYQGNLKGVYFYNEALEATTITNIQNHLT